MTSKTTASSLSRIANVLQAASGRGDKTVAVMVPRYFAYRLIDELYPQLREVPDGGIEAFDVIHHGNRLRRDAERDRYRSLIEVGGYVGKIYDFPMVVADDVLICALSDRDLVDCARRIGFSVDEVLRECPA